MITQNRLKQKAEHGEVLEVVIMPYLLPYKAKGAFIHYCVSVKLRYGANIQNAQLTTVGENVRWFKNLSTCAKVLKSCGITNYRIEGKVT